MRRIVLTCCRDRDGTYQVESGAIEAGGAKLADFVRGSGGVVEVSIPPKKVSALVIRLRGKTDKVKHLNFMNATPWLSEVEVY